jgi:hypothetical protein
MGMVPRWHHALERSNQDTLLTPEPSFAQENRHQILRRLKPLQQEREAGLRRLANGVGVAVGRLGVVVAANSFAGSSGLSRVFLCKAPKPIA